MSVASEDSSVSSTSSPDKLRQLKKREREGERDRERERERERQVFHNTCCQMTGETYVVCPTKVSIIVLS